MTDIIKDHRLCILLSRRLSEWIDGELEESVSNELENHLEQCIGCHIYFKTFKQTVDICRKIGRKPMPTDLSQRVNSIVAQMPVIGS